MNHRLYSMSARIASAAIILFVLFSALIACKSPAPESPTDTIRSEAPTESVTSAVSQGDPETYSVTVTAPHETRPPSEPPTDASTETEAPEPPSDSNNESSPAEELPILPMESNTYVLGDPDSPSRGIDSYRLFTETHRLYLGEAFTLYGLYQHHEDIPCISFGTDMNIPLLFLDEIGIPDEGAFVKLSAVYGFPPAEMDLPSAFTCMTVSAVEVIKAPEAEELIMYVMAELLFVRATPDSGDGSAPIAALPKGAPVRILESSCGSSGEWCRIAFEGDVGYGYVKALYLTGEPIP